MSTCAHLVVGCTCLDAANQRAEKAEAFLCQMRRASGEIGERFDAARARVSELEAALRELLTFSVRGHTVAEGTGEANGILQRVDAALATDKVETPEMSPAVAKAMDRFWRKCAEVDAAKADTDAPRHICEQCSGSGSCPEANACPVCAGTGWDSPVQADAPPTDAEVEYIVAFLERLGRGLYADQVRRFHAHAKRLEILEAQGREHAKNCAIVETELRERAEAAELKLAEISELAGPGGDDTPFGRVESMLCVLTSKRAEAERALANDQHHGARVLDLACKLRATTDAHGELANRLAEAERDRNKMAAAADMWMERTKEAERARGAANAKATQYESDWRAAKIEFGDSAALFRKRIAELETKLGAGDVKAKCLILAGEKRIAVLEAHLDREQKLRLLYADERDQLRAENAQLRGQLSGVCDCGAQDGDDHDDDCRRVIQPAIADGEVVK